MIRDVLFSGAGISLGYFWLTHGSVAVAICMFVVAGYLFGLSTTSRAWRRAVAPLTRNQPAPRSGT
jgi:hypothetical protein